MHATAKLRTCEFPVQLRDNLAHGLGCSRGGGDDVLRRATALQYRIIRNVFKHNPIGIITYDLNYLPSSPFRWVRQQSSA